MGRIIRKLKLGDEEAKALFDTGSERSYVKDDKVPEPRTCEKIKPTKVALGGKKQKVTESCIVKPKIEEEEFDFEAHTLDEIGKVDGEELDLLIGSTAMEKWNIKLDPEKRKLDLTGLKKREFTEF